MKTETTPDLKNAVIPRDTVQQSVIIPKDTVTTSQPVTTFTEQPVRKDTLTYTDLKNETPPAKTETVSVPDKPVTDSVQLVKPEEKTILNPARTETIKADTITRIVQPDPDQPFVRTKITRRSESSTTEGFGVVYTDEYPDGHTDTIRILIPHPKALVKPVTKPADEKQFLDIPVNAADSLQQKTNDSVVITPVTVQAKDTVAAPDTPKEKARIPGTDSLISKPVNDSAAQMTADIKTTVTNNSNCTEAAADADFLKLRKKMASVEGNDDMIMEARKYFRLKCFSTLQIKNLGALFLDDEGKYHFFDEAYPHVTDLDLFVSLQDELKDEYYKNRFRAMLRH